MSKFKVGDKVIRTGKTFGEAIKGGVYVVSEVSRMSTGINLLGHELNKNSGDASFKYDCGGFELDNEEHLTPEQVFKALSEGEFLEVLDEGEWLVVLMPERVTFRAMQTEKFRLKPKTIDINGVIVPAPHVCTDFTKDNIVYYISMLCKKVNSVAAIEGDATLYWATEKDAQQVLDAILIPFRELDND